MSRWSSPFRVAERQYEYGFSDAEALSQEVIDGLEIRIVRVIAATFCSHGRPPTPTTDEFPLYEPLIIPWRPRKFIATVDSFRVAERQYEYGFSDAEALSQEVIDGLEPSPFDHNFFLVSRKQPNQRLNLGKPQKRAGYDAPRLIPSESLSGNMSMGFPMRRRFPRRLLTDWKFASAQSTQTQPIWS
jgi:predicted Rdx family selenoprotein